MVWTSHINTVLLSLLGSFTRLRSPSMKGEGGRPCCEVLLPSPYSRRLFSCALITAWVHSFFFPSPFLLLSSSLAPLPWSGSARLADTTSKLFILFTPLLHRSYLDPGARCVASDPASSSSEDDHAAQRPFRPRRPFGPVEMSSPCLISGPTSRHLRPLFSAYHIA